MSSHVWVFIATDSTYSQTARCGGDSELDLLIGYGLLFSDSIPEGAGYWIYRVSDEINNLIHGTDPISRFRVAMDSGELIGTNQK